MDTNKDEAIYVTETNVEFGTVKIADDVVATIAAIAAGEVDGVVSMVGNISNDLKSKIGVKNSTKGVKVEVIGKQVKVDLSIIVAYGCSIPSLSQKVQEKVKTTIENMTGLTVSDVNVRIAGIDKV